MLRPCRFLSFSLIFKRWPQEHSDPGASPRHYCHDYRHQIYRYKIKSGSPEFRTLPSHTLHIYTHQHSTRRSPSRCHDHGPFDPLEDQSPRPKCAHGRKRDHAGPICRIWTLGCLSINPPSCVGLHTGRTSHVLVTD